MQLKPQTRVYSKVLLRCPASHLNPTMFSQLIVEVMEFKAAQSLVSKSTALWAAGQEKYLAV